MSDLSEQLNLNNQINEAIKQRSMLVGDLTRLLSDQNSIAKELCESLKCIDTEKLNSNLVNTKDAVDSLKKASKESTETLSDMGETIKKKPRILNDATKAMGGFVAGGLSAKLLGKVFDSLKGKLKSAFIGIKSIGSALGGFGKAVLSFPFKMLSGLIEMSNDLGRITELTRAFEDIREKFGDLEKGTSKILKDSLRPMVKQFNQTAAAGHSFAKTFGRGPAGLANALKFNAELMEKLNGGTQQLREEIGQNIAAMAIYRKGMGFTADQQATLVALADAQGKSITGVQHEYAKFSLQMGKRFGLDSKLIGKSMADMTADVGNFGTLSTRQLAQVATFTQKLGIETKALQGVIKKYDDFESAAKSAAMLNQTFGMQVDVMKMMKDEDPASRLNQLQKSFQATGKSYAQLSRAERNRLADLAGLDAKSAELAFSQKGLSMSYEDIQGAGEESETSFADINDTLKELSKNMKKVFEEPQSFKSFFEAFSRGFNKGFVLAAPFMKVMTNIRQSLISTEGAGRLVGRMFQAMIPGVDKILEGLEKFFNPAATKDGLGKMIASIDKFFNALKGGPKVFKQALKDLWTDLSQDFMNFFGGKGEATSALLDGLGQFYSNIINFALSFGSIIIDVFSKGLRNVTKVLRGQMSFKELFGIKSDKDLTAGLDIGGTLKKTFGDSFNELIASLKTELWPALKDAFSAIVDVVLVPFWKNTLWPWIKTLPGLFWGAIANAFKDGSYLKAAAIILAPFLIIFGPKAVVGVLGKTMLKTFGAIAGKVGGLFSTSISKGAGKGVEKASKKSAKPKGKGSTKALGGAMDGLAQGALAGAAKGLMAWANPMILKGAAILSGSIAIIAAGIAASAWMIGKTLPTLGKGLTSLNDVDGLNLVIVGGGLVALGAGLSAMAVGSIASVVTAMVSLFTGKSPFQGIVDFSRLDIDGPKVESNAKAVEAFARASARMGVGQGVAAIGHVMNGIAEFLFGSPITKMQEQINDFQALKIDPSKVENVSVGLESFGHGMRVLNAIPIPRMTGGGFLGGIANFFAGTPSVKQFDQPLKEFQELEVKSSKVKRISEGLESFADGMKTLSNVNIPRTGDGIFGSMGNFFLGAKLGMKKDENGEGGTASISDYFQPLIDSFQALTLKSSVIKRNSDSLVQFAHGMRALNTIDLPRVGNNGIWDYLADSFSGEQVPRNGIATYFNPIIKSFEALEFNDRTIIRNSESTVAFAEGVKALSDINLPRKQGDGLWDTMGSWFEGDKIEGSSLYDTFNPIIQNFQNLDYKKSKLEKNVEGTGLLARGLESLSGIKLPRTGNGLLGGIMAVTLGEQMKPEEIGTHFKNVIDGFQELTFEDAGELEKKVNALGALARGLELLKGIELPRTGNGVIGGIKAALLGGKGKPEDVMRTMQILICGFQKLEFDNKLETNVNSMTIFARGMGIISSINIPEGSENIFKATWLVRGRRGTGFENLRLSILKFKELPIDDTVRTKSDALSSFANALRNLLGIEFKNNENNIFNQFKSGIIDLNALKIPISQFLTINFQKDQLTERIAGMEEFNRALGIIMKIPIEDGGEGTLLTEKLDFENLKQQIAGLTGISVDTTAICKIKGEFDLVAEAMNSLNLIKLDENTPDNLDFVKTGAESYKSIIDQLKGFTFDKAAIDVTQLNAFKESLATYAPHVSGISTQLNQIFTNYAEALPEELLNKSQRVMQAVTDMENQFQAISNKEVVATAIKIGESFNGNSTVTFQHENININLEVAVQMSAEDLLRGIIKTTVKGTDGKADREVRVVTDPSDPFAT